MGHMIKYPDLRDGSTLFDFYGNPIPAGGTIPGGGTGMPIANPFGITTATRTPDPIAGTHNQLWVKFPTDASVMAWGLSGDSFPRVVFGSDPTDSGFAFFMLGDGTYNPTLNSNLILLKQDATRGNLMQISGFNSNVGAVLGGYVAFDSGASITPTSPAVRGDVFASDRVSGANGSSWWRATGTNTWALQAVISTTDPITAGAVPANPGALWHDTAGSGSLWMSTGTSAGSWAQIWPHVTASNSVTGVGGTGALQTLMTTPSLAVGVWKIDAALQFSSTTVGHSASLSAAAGTATATFSGANSLTGSVPGNAEPVTTAITLYATVTVAGTLLIQTVANAAGTINVAGYTALKVG